MKKKSLKYQLKSFGWALNGLSEFFKNEFKATTHLFSTIIVIVLGFMLKLSPIEWCIIIIVIGFVFVTEILNTAIETISDTIPDKYDKIRGRTKDIAAGAVLISSVVALIIGAIIFLPKIFIQ